MRLFVAFLLHHGNFAVTNFNQFQQMITARVSDNRNFNVHQVVVNGSESN
jgi:hypothetical protein